MIKINHRRFNNNFFTLAKIGETSDGGIHRQTFSKAHIKARKWFKDQAIKSGFEFMLDRAGNHIARLSSNSPEAPVFIIGSHLDSVPNGGKYDGALGVVAALEVLNTIKENNIGLPFHLEAIDFTDEEGSLIGLLGSSAMVGKIGEKSITKSRVDKEILSSGLSIYGLTSSDLHHAKRDLNKLAGYLELHIEQGNHLSEGKYNIGIVTGIVGINSYRIHYHGRADHAGTTKMETRLDASQGASAFTLESHQIVTEQYPSCVMNIGNMVFSPGVFNIVPEKVTISLEIRAPKMTMLNEMESVLIDLSREKANEFSLGLEIEHLGKYEPAILNPRIRSMINRVSKSLGLSSVEIASGAGHDAQSFANICPSGVIFVPSQNGFSHSPMEYTSWQDCLNGANVLLNTTLQCIEYLDQV